ncbi:MAG: tRNA (adenosine(37)-N6)-dimethylallyltransferase, partial [Acidimicrobiales bacterium]
MTGGPGPHLALVGPTASGKSAVAVEVARRRPDVELVSVDSMQVYRDMDIGTAKPTPVERAEVPVHLVDLADPSEDFSVVQFQAAARRALAAIEGRGHRALLVGGTGLYLRAVVDGLEVPPRWPGVRAELEAEPDTTALHRRLAALDPVAAGRMTP